jgi:RNA polymerase sigma-70 factor, ECF subfamily
MSTAEWHLPDRPDAVLDSVSEQDRNRTFIATVYQYSAVLHRVARSVTRDVSEAEDVVQETFLRALRHRNKLAELRDARTWLIRITWNLALDRKRRAKVRRQTDDFEEVARFLTTGGRSAEAELITAQHRAGVLRHIDTLPAREREVFLLSAVDELSTVEIALVLKTTDSTIRSRLYRARKALQVLIGQDGSLRQDFKQVDEQARIDLPPASPANGHASMVTGLIPVIGQPTAHRIDPRQHIQSGVMGSPRG